ncbi:1-phosphofructokinase [Gordonia spumicola]|uniref:1-phosphofructokinase n=1 Tax=Gordonia spumicola TaxID=589161 RepID=A0A7I9VBQ7_9ACTN|nr:1-phosphofructokinase family hexose kinase [Gordonia spumicola]GEE02581.1 1-phosphofructokinase [Gordonia spumicola]
MILTVTANPSIDRTITLDGPLVAGAVHRPTGVLDQPGGKGVNVARVVQAAGFDTLALVPAAAGDTFLAHLDHAHLPHVAVATAGTVRTNLTIVDPDGVTTKINTPGADVDAETLTAAVVERAGAATWLALCGSLPPGLPDTWYADLVARVRQAGVRVAVDTSGAPLTHVTSAGPHLMKPNSEELAELTGADPSALEAAAGAGDPSAAAAASLELAASTGGAVLTTLGGSGAVLAVDGKAWFATAPRIRVRSTVGAGDSSLAGYLIAEVRGDDPARRLANAVAYGSAAAALPGTTPPTPDMLDDSVSVTPL